METSKELKAIEDAINKYKVKHGEKSCVVTSVKAFDDNGDLVEEKLLAFGDGDELSSLWFDTFHTLNTDNHDESWDDVEEVLDEFEEDSEEVIEIVTALCDYYEKYGENVCIISHVFAIDKDGVDCDEDDEDEYEVMRDDEMFLIVGNKQRLVEMNKEINKYVDSL